MPWRGVNEMEKLRRLKRHKLPAASEFAARIKNDRVLKALFEVMFEQENRIRALENKSPITRAQAKTVLKQKFTSGT